MNALGALGKLAEKPSNTKIRLTRIIFALLLIAIIVFGFLVTDVNVSFFDMKFVDLPDELLYILFLFPAVGLIRGIFDPGLFKKSVWRKIIMALGFLMMIFSVFFLSEKKYIPQTKVENTLNTQEITADTISTVQTKDDMAIFAIMSTDNWLFFFGFITFFVGFALNGKNLTTKNEKYGETIKKIRV